MDVPDSWVGGILTRLDLVVLERIPHGVFLRVGGGAPPLWFSRVMAPAASGDGVTVAAAIPFLEQFLTEAEPFWSNVREGRLRSEPFMVADPEGGELALVATAIGLGPRNFLVLAIEPTFDQRRQSLQIARENRLEYERHVRRTGELASPLALLQKQAGQLAATGLSAEQASLVQAMRDELTAVAKAVETLAPLPKGDRRG
jgi:hypothetical protein